MPRDYRDLTIEALADRCAELQDENRALHALAAARERDIAIYQMMFLEALTYSHNEGVRFARLRDAYVALREQYRLLLDAQRELSEAA